MSSAGHVSPPSRSPKGLPRFSTCIRKINGIVRKRSSDSFKCELSKQSDGAAARPSTAKTSSPPVSISSRKNSPNQSPRCCSRLERNRSHSGSPYSYRSNGRSSTFSRASTSTTIDRRKTQEERAANMFAKFGLTMGPMQCSFPTMSDEVQRVSKRPRLRMHTTCHHCKTRFRSSPHCEKCSHRLCRDCPRTAPQGVRDLVSQTKMALAAVDEARAVIVGEIGSGLRDASLVDAQRRPTSKSESLPYGRQAVGISVRATSNGLDRRESCTQVHTCATPSGSPVAAATTTQARGRSMEPRDDAPSDDTKTTRPT